MIRLFNKIRFRAWAALSSLVDLLHPGYLTAEATVGRVQAFHDLLHDTQMHRRADAAQHQQPAPSEPSQVGPINQSAQAAADMEEGDLEQTAEKIRNAFMQEGRLEELAQITLDLSAFQSAEDVPSHILQQATAVFIKRYSRAMNRLLGIADDTA